MNAPASPPTDRRFQRVPITPGNLPTLADYDEALIEIERVGGELRRAIEQVQTLRKQLEDEKWECKQHKNAADELRARERLRLASEPRVTPEQAFELGWRAAVGWTNGDYSDLLTDIGSPAYQEELEHALRLPPTKTEKPL